MPKSRDPEPTRKAEPARFLSRLDLRAALAGPGCPLCGGLDRAERGLMASFLQEGMMSPPVRADFLQRNGFCGRHWWLALVVQSAASTGRLGVAILCEHWLRQALAAPELMPARKGVFCWICEACQDREKLLLDAIERLPSRELDACLERMCLPHVRRALADWGHAVAQRLWVALPAIAESYRRQLRGWIEADGPPSTAASDVTRAAVQFLAGRP